MFLSAHAIARAVEQGRITISPFDPTRLSGASYTFGVGDDLLRVDPTPVGGEVHFKPHRMPLVEGAWRLEPGALYLAATAEVVGSDEFAMRLIGRPSLGHVGLFLQVSADLGHQGARHAWTLEIVATNTTLLRPGDPIGQVAFCVSDGAISPYKGVFGATSEPLMSTLHTRPAA